MATQFNRPPLRKITDFKSKLVGGGARPNLFEVELAFPEEIAIDNDVKDKARFLVKAAALPASNITPIDVNFRGRILKIAGDRTFDTWTITVINDESFNLRTAFEKWMNGISKLDDGTGIVNPNYYMTDAMVRQLGRSNTAGSLDNNSVAGQQNVVLRTYNFFDIFPTEVSAIDLSYDTSDTIEEFTVTFAVQYYAIGLNVNDAPDPTQEPVPTVLASNDLVSQPTPVG